MVLLPDGGPQSAYDEVVEASEPHGLRRPTPDRSRMPDGGPQSADDEVGPFPPGLLPSC